MTRKQLERFVQIRNASGFSTNLQFAIDLQEVGLTLADIGQAYRHAEGGYRWDTPVGVLREDTRNVMWIE